MTTSSSRVRNVLAQSPDFARVCATPMFGDALHFAEPLMDAGKVDGTGPLIGDAWNARALRVVEGEP